MSARSAWVDDANAALLTDLYQLTMLQAYWKEGIVDEAVFSLYFRELPAARNFVLACGLDHVLQYLETLHFEVRALEDLQRLDGSFCDGFLAWLSELRFRGAVRAVAEGVPVLFSIRGHRRNRPRLGSCHPPAADAAVPSLTDPRSLSTSTSASSPPATAT